MPRDLHNALKPYRRSLQIPNIQRACLYFIPYQYDNGWNSGKKAPKLPIMKSLIALAVLSTGLVSAQESSGSRTLWRVSMISLATANALDVHSSWGKLELNPGL